MPATFARALPLVPLLFACAAPLRAEEKADPEADRMMRVAHQARSGWSAAFPGFAAALSVTIDGETAQGSLQVDAAGKVRVELASAPHREWVERTLESITMHRQAGVREQYDVSFADDVKQHPLGRLIKFHGGATHSLYRVKDDVITEVHRTMEKEKFTITVSDVLRTPLGKTLPSHFNVSYWDKESGALLRNDDFQDRWTQLETHDIPISRLQIRTEKQARKVFAFQLSDVRLLPAKAAAPSK